MTVEPVVEGFRFRQTAGEGKVLFEGDAGPHEVGRDNPFMLDWI